MLKKSVLAVVLLFLATNVWAVLGPADVSVGPHNLSTSSSLADGHATNPGPGNEDEICIFCHTPHGGTLNGPLWNRTLPNQSVGFEFTHYKSTRVGAYTATLVQTRAVQDESLLCMSCHDGLIAYNSIINNSNRTGAAPNNGVTMQPMFGAGPVIGDPADIPSGIPAGKNLSDDHPISFSYTAAEAISGGKLDTLTNAQSAGVRFFGATNRVECSTCHDPHVNFEAGGNSAYTPFLVTPNAGSNLCLACHKK